MDAAEAEGREKEEAALSVVKHEVARTIGLLVVVLDGQAGMRAACMVTGPKADGMVRVALRSVLAWVVQERWVDLDL